MRPDSLPRLWRYINLLLTYLLTYVLCITYVKFNYTFEFLTPTSLFIISLSLVSDEEWGVFTVWASNIKGEIEQKFSKSNFSLSKFWHFRDLVCRLRDMKSSNFTARGTSLRKWCASFEPFCVKVGWGGCVTPIAEEENVRVTPGSRWNMPALTWSYLQVNEVNWRRYRFHRIVRLWTGWGEQRLKLRTSNLT